MVVAGYAVGGRMSGGGGLGGGVASASKRVPAARQRRRRAGDRSELASAPDANRPSETALAMIRQSQQRRYQQIAMLDDAQREQRARAAAGEASRLAFGTVLSEAEQKRQDAAADQAYAILLDLIKTTPVAEQAIAEVARSQVMWLIGFFEGQQRSERAIVLIKRYLSDRPSDPARLALTYRAITDQFAVALECKPTRAPESGLAR